MSTHIDVNQPDANGHSPLFRCLVHDRSCHLLPWLMQDSRIQAGIAPVWDVIDHYDASIDYDYYAARSAFSSDARKYLFLANFEYEWMKNNLANQAMALAYAKQYLLKHLLADVVKNIQDYASQPTAFGTLEGRNGISLAQKMQMTLDKFDPFMGDGDWPDVIECVEEFNHKLSNYRITTPSFE